MNWKYHAALGLALAGFGSAAGLAQTISDFNPKFGTTNDVIVITGSGFASGTMTVRFWNGILAPNKYVNDDNHITVNVPAGATYGPVSVQRNSNTPVYSSAQFTMIGKGAHITGFSPVLGAVGDTVILSGVHFLTVTNVRFNTTSAAFTPNGDGTQITAYVPSGATNGLISVRSSATAGASNSPSAFTVIGPGPYISGFTPASYDGGPIYVHGRFFTGATAVRFNGTNAASYFVAGDTQIQATPAASVSTGPITVVTPLGSYTTSSNFFVPPVITGFSPATGRSGTNVIITGRNLNGATRVLFNWQEAAFVTNSSTQITATVPAGATTGVVAVDSPAGSYPTISNFVVLPTVSGFSPAFGLAGTSVTVTGANFNVGTPQVKFGGVTAGTPTGVTFSQLTVSVPAAATNAPITVTTTDGSGTSAASFFVPARITTFTPTNGAPGTLVTLTGVNFLGATAVTFSNVPAASFGVSNNTTLGAIVPAGVVTGPMLVTTPAGTTNSGSRFFYGAPGIAGFAPMSGLPGTNVVLTGTNFLGATAVRFNGQTAGFTPPTNNTALVATVPSGASTGPITVVTPGGTNTSASPFTLNYSADLSLTMTAWPDFVWVGSNLVYTLTLNNSGPHPSPWVTVSNTLPPELLLKSAFTTQGALNTNNNPVLVNITNLAKDMPVTIVFIGTPVATGWITNRATVTGPYADSTPANNLAAVGTLVRSVPLLSVRRPQPNRVRLAWPADLSDFALQFRPSADASHFWSNTPTVPVLSGEELVVTETNTEPLRLYRLKK